MSIAPVQSLSSLGSEPSESRSVRPFSGATRSESPTTTRTTRSSSDPRSEARTDATKAVTSTYQLPSDVVELHQDPDLKGQVVIQYLDQSKNVILQVPSAQELDFERSIAQEFQKAAKQQQSEDAATTTTAANEGDTTHGDQL